MSWESVRAAAIGRGRGVALLSCALACIVAACGGGGGGGGGGATAGNPSPSGPAAPAAVTLMTTSGNVLVDWTPVAGAAAYRVYWNTSPGIDPTMQSYTQTTAPPLQLTGATSGSAMYCVVTTVGGGEEGLPSTETSVTVALASPEKYYPAWWRQTPLATFFFNYDGGQTSQQNGAALASVINSLVPGDRLEVGSGTYTINSVFNINTVGTATNPIWIVAQSGATPIITRSNASQNTVNMGAGGGSCRFTCLRGLEITGGSIALRMYDCEDVWIDKCHIHDCQDNAIAANSNPTEDLTFTENVVHGTGGTGEGFYIGGNNASPISARAVIALNHVYDTGGTQGDGIELKQGSWGAWIAENTVHDNNYPSILVYGTGGMPVNLIERNVCWNSGDNVMQVQGEAIVRNNVLINGANAFYSGNHQGTVTNLKVMNNTFINTGQAARLQDWGGKAGMVFANNACYSQSGNAITFGGAAGVTIAGNVAVGGVSGTGSGFTAGVGLSDFAGVTYSATSRNVTPAASGALIGAGEAAQAPLDDLSGEFRLGTVEAGAVDGD
jgi:hypothetical protein